MKVPFRPDNDIAAPERTFTLGKMKRMNLNWQRRESFISRDCLFRWNIVQGGFSRCWKGSQSELVKRMRIMWKRGSKKWFIIDFRLRGAIMNGKVDVKNPVALLLWATNSPKSSLSWFITDMFPPEKSLFIKHFPRPLIRWTHYERLKMYRCLLSVCWENNSTDELKTFSSQFYGAAPRAECAFYNSNTVKMLNSRKSSNKEWWSWKVELRILECKTVSLNL